MDELNTRYSASWLSDDLKEDELLSRFRAQLARITSPDDAPQAEDIIHNIPVYAGDTVRTAAQDSSQRKALLAEWTDIFGHGAGVFAIRNAMDELAVLDRATAIFTSIIEAEKSGSAGGGDHFAKAGANDRIWNALEKHCLADPENFAA